MEDVTLFSLVFVMVPTCNITSILIGQVSKTILADLVGSCACLMRGGPVVRLFGYKIVYMWLKVTMAMD